MVDYSRGGRLYNEGAYLIILYLELALTRGGAHFRGRLIEALRYFISLWAKIIKIHHVILFIQDKVHLQGTVCKNAGCSLWSK